MGFVVKHLIENRSPGTRIKERESEIRILLHNLQRLQTKPKDFRVLGGLRNPPKKLVCVQVSLPCLTVGPELGQAKGEKGTRSAPKTGGRINLAKLKVRRRICASSSAPPIEADCRHFDLGQ
ncbi:hypothetical protein TSAR_005865 [Trichomalopsis sarcophagae]|uniref:Uncharacterized protein n=1 Tax=Trichomalopsis sarcophagae TaxID=543379 RepID=A0A232ESY7_9HYME|nr:hypothetical protein TSAR_005865 [Trichomalopsis sarcophagae]